MRMAELLQEYRHGKIEKKTYWMLMREKMRTLAEIQQILQESEECESIRIGKTDIVQENALGVKTYYDFTQPACRAELELYLAADPERENMTFVSHNLKDHAVVFDIGANVGLYSLNLYQKNKSAQFYAFEPLPDTFANLKRTMALNGVVHEKIQCFNIGFSNREGVEDFYLPAESEAASLMPIEDAFYMQESNELGEYSGRRKVQKVPCQVCVLDDWCGEHQINQMDFIKIDVEGNEKYVLKGAEGVLSKFKPMVYCELLRKHTRRFGYHPNDVIAFMAGLGYRCVVVRDARPAPIEAIDDQTIETNFFFLHQERHKELLAGTMG